MNRDNNIVDMKHHIDPADDLSSEMIQAYLDAADMNTPDLWNRIEKGYEAETEKIKKEEQMIFAQKRAAKKKWIGIAAAALLVLFISVPVIMLSLRKKDDSAASDENRVDLYNAYELNEEAVTEAVAESVEGNPETVTEASAAADSVAAAEAEESVPADQSVQGVVSLNSETQGAGKYLRVTGTVRFLENGECELLVEQVESSDYKEFDIRQGTIIRLICDGTIKAPEDGSHAELLLDCVTGDKIAENSAEDSDEDTGEDTSRDSYTARLIEVL